MCEVCLRLCCERIVWKQSWVGCQAALGNNMRVPYFCSCMCVHANALQCEAKTFTLSKFMVGCRMRVVAPTATNDMCHFVQ